MENDLVAVYTGSRVEGQFVTELLKEKGIGSIYRDFLQESVDAGWGDGLPEDAVQVFVEESNAEEAKAFLDEYFKNRDKK